jgi:AcrR family transcriptional regulator
VQVVDSPPTARNNTRAIARAAVRAELSQAAFELARAKGFNNITVDDMAAASGVSRSTFMRYFSTKEEAILSAFDAHADWVADALRARPADENDWTALRNAFEAMLPYYLSDPTGALAITQLINETPALSGGFVELQHSWRPPLSSALAERHGLDPEAPPITIAVKVSAALDCIQNAVMYWTDSNGTLDLVALVDEAFSTFE